MSHDTTTRRRFVALAGSLTVAGTAGCAGPSGATTQGGTDPPEGTSTPSPTDPPTTTPTPDEGATGPVVEMRTDDAGSYFDPNGLQVEPGTTVRFVNESGSHNTAAYHPDTGDVPLRIPEGAEPWDSEVFAEAGRSFEVTLETPGVYDYYCRPHEMLGMVGRIIVGGPQGGPGTTEPEDVPPAARETFPSVDEILEDGTVSGP